MLNKNVYLTGETGFLGSSISSSLKTAGCSVKPVLDNHQKRWRFGQTCDLSGTEKGDILVHSAWNMKVDGWEDNVSINVNPSLHLLEEAHKKGMKLVFVSTMSAFDGCESNYGRAKLVVEEFVVKNGGIVLRPGLLWKQPFTFTGVMAAIHKLVKALPVIPYIASSKIQLYATNVESLCALIVEQISATDGEQKGRVLIYANPRVLNLKSLIKVFACIENKTVFCLPVPSFAIKILLKLISVLKLNFIKTDSLTSLMSPEANPTFAKESNSCPDLVEMACGKK